MGLDMYLERETYIGANYSFQKEEIENFKIEYPEAHIKRERVSKVIESVAYWSKANQIHKWFVDNIQGGKDECQRSYVPRGKLKKLRNLCSLAMEDKDATLLPPSDGFFFGGVEIDEWYWSGIKSTIDQMNDILSLPGEEDKASYYYHSSW
jgi:hypothetical protein